MRMWMLNPEYMCVKHIVGEHGEIHKHRHNFAKKHNMGKRLSERQIFPAYMKARHDELAKYINHKSEYEQPDISYLGDDGEIYPDFIDYSRNMYDLCDRCPDCRKKFKEAGMI